MMQFKRSVLSVAMASALQALAVSAYAADADAEVKVDEQTAEQTKKEDAEEGVERIEVTGIRGGIQRSVDAKRESTEIVEAISAEDFGKLPDVSIAESLARLPGLTGQRVAGRGQTIQIRGMADDFGTALLNGREQVSVGHNRGVEFDQYPAELMSAVMVYKTPKASLVGQGLSGTVDLRTVQPLDYAERVFSTGLRLEENSLGALNPDSDDRGNRFNFSYIDQLLDGKLGVAVGYAHLDTPSQAQRWDSWGYAGQDLTDTSGTHNGIRVLGGTKAQASSTENVREGLMAVLEFKPNDFWHSTVDAYRSTFEADETLRFIEAGTVWISPCRWNCSPTPIPPALDYNLQGSALMSGRFSGVNPVVRNDMNTTNDEIDAFGWKNQFQFSEAWSAELDLSHSEASRKAMISETYAGRGHAEFLGWNQPAPYLFHATDTLDFYINRNGFTRMELNESYSDPNTLFLTDPMGWGQEGYVKYPQVTDELDSYRVSFERQFESGALKSLQFGFNNSEREKTRAVDEYILRLKNGPEAVIPTAAIIGTVDLGFAGAPDTLALDYGQLMGMYDFVSNIHPDIRRKTWLVNEKVDTVYTQLNLESNWGDVTVAGNVGVQYVSTTQYSEGVHTSNGSFVSGGSSYNDVLPSINFSFSGDESVVRLGVAKQIARARMDDMRASQDVSIATTGAFAGRWVANGGNPELQPWEANAFDLSYEFYFAEAAYFAVATFYKDLETYIVNGTVEYDFSGIDTTPYPQNQLPLTPIGYLSGPTNGEGGMMRGYEVSMSLPLNEVLPVPEGFGVLASYSDTASKIEQNGVEITMPGLSEKVSNITLFYDNNGFSGRVSLRSRSDFLGEVQGFGGDRSQVFIRGEDVVDTQFSYTFDFGMTALLQISNLTNEGYSQYFKDQENLPQFYAEYGRTYALGVSYKF